MNENTTTIAAIATTIAAAAPTRRKRSDTNPAYGKGPTLMEQRMFLLGVNRDEYIKKYCR